VAAVDRIVFRQAWIIGTILLLINLAELVGLIMLTSNWLAFVNLVGGLLLATVSIGHEVALAARDRSRVAHPAT